MSTTDKSLSVLNALADAAKAITGSDYKTAKALGVTPARLGDWRAGRQSAQPEHHALLAAIAGLDAEEALIRATLYKYEDKPMGERLMTALGKGLRQTGAAAFTLLIASVGLVMTPTTSNASTKRSTSASDNVHRAKRRATILRLSNAI